MSEIAGAKVANEDCDSTAEIVARRCRDIGLDVERVEQEGTVIVIHPAGAEDLPGQEELAKLAANLPGGSARYVTISLDGYRQEASDGR